MKYILVVIALICLVSFSFAAVNTANLKSYWKLDSNSSNTTLDEKSYNAFQFVSPAGTGGVGIYGTTGLFSASTGYMKTPDNNYKYSNYSVSVWFKTSSDGVIFWNECNRTAAHAEGWMFWLTAGVIYWFQGTTSGASETTYTSVTPNLENGAWHHMVATYNGTSKCMYLDGKLDKACQASALSYGTQTILTRLGGGYINSALWQPWSGSLDEVGIWDTALSGTGSTSDVNLLYNSGSGVTYCPASDTFAISCVTDECARTINTDWNISTEVTCTSKTILMGTGILRINTGGRLILNSSTLTAKRLLLNTTGIQIKLTNSWMKLG